MYVTVAMKEQAKNAISLIVDNVKDIDAETAFKGCTFTRMNNRRGKRVVAIFADGTQKRVVSTKLDEEDLTTLVREGLFFGYGDANWWEIDDVWSLKSYTPMIIETIKEATIKRLKKDAEIAANPRLYALY